MALCESAEEVLQLLATSLAEAERRLGPDFKRTHKGIFWIDDRTRPYMCILQTLADFHEASGNRNEAISVYEQILALNPNDNQGVRYILAGLLLAEKRLPKARKLLEAYPDDTAWLTWARALYFFLIKDRTKAAKMLKKARAENPYVELYFTEEREMPESLPDHYCLGEDSEAVCIVDSLTEGWFRRKDAGLWLLAQLSGDKAMMRAISRLMITGR